MGLQEKRWQEDFEKEKVPTYTAKVKEAIGFCPEFRVKYDSFNVQGFQYLEYSGLDKVLDALKQVGRDDLGKQALKKNVKEVVLNCAKEPGKRKIDLKEGVLAITMGFGLEGENNYFYPENIAKYLEENL